MANRVVITGVNTALLPKLSGSEQAELMKKVKEGDEKARELFATCNMRLVLSVVQRFINRKENTDDIFQVGCVGLMKAIDNFDVNLNVKFSTYAVPMIVGEIKRFLRDNNSIRVSRSMRDTAYQALKVKEQLMKESDKEPNITDIALKLDLPVNEVAIALDAISEPMSMSEPIYSDGEDTIFLDDQVSDSFDSENKWLEDINLKESLKNLDDREREILMLRYYIGKTQMEVSDEVGISQAQVSRLEKNAIDAIRKNFV